MKEVVFWCHFGAVFSTKMASPRTNSVKVQKLYPENAISRCNYLIFFTKALEGKYLMACEGKSMYALHFRSWSEHLEAIVRAAFLVHRKKNFKSFSQNRAHCVNQRPCKDRLRLICQLPLPDVVYKLPVFVSRLANLK